MANRFHWVSVLKYDDEFRLLQATYNYPWSFDSNHSHTVFLEPFPKGQSVARWVLVLTLTPFLPLQPLLTMGTLFAVISILKAVAPSLTAFMYTFATAASLGEMLVDKPNRVIPLFLRFSSQQGPHPNDCPFPTTPLTRMSGYANFKATRMRIFLRMALLMAFNWQILALRSHQWTCKIINQLRAPPPRLEWVKQFAKKSCRAIMLFKPAVVSVLGAIPIPNSTEIRIIYDCSRPHGQAVNDYITTRSFKFQ